ncbi:MAG: hypothetical protein IPP77_11205 [Bacteroidetes bacterium]|nr:hypothetical protein [Bacteroidota bacterium]
MNREELQDMLQNLDEDGIQYAHFLGNHEHPGYFGVMVRERTPEYIKKWLPHDNLKDYSLALSIPVDDAEFLDYMLQTYTDQIDVPVLRKLCKLEGTSNPQKFVDGFHAWRQERIRVKREKFLSQYPWEVTSSILKNSGT